jgi:phosphonate transport system substrate-binding protein
VLLLLVPLAVITVLGVKLATSRIIADAQKQSEATMLHWFELSSPTPRRLDERFTDADGDLVADTPQASELQQSPTTLKFCYIAGPDAEDERAAWQDLVAHLSKAVGRPIEMVAFHTTNEELDALANRSVQIAGFNTGAVPVAVASSGFVPAVTFGKENGSFGITMELIVPAESEIGKLPELKGHTVTFTSRDSNSGCKAALALLQDNELLPMKDYMWKFSGGHEESIKGVASGRYDAAPVASDLLQRAISAEVVKKDDVRSIYESEEFPPATIGYAYDLAPELAASIRKALIEFNPQGTSLQRQFDAAGATRFVPIAYKQDFALIRRIDDAFRKPLKDN